MSSIVVSRPEQCFVTRWTGQKCNKYIPQLPIASPQLKGETQDLQGRELEAFNLKKITLADDIAAHYFTVIYSVNYIAEFQSMYLYLGYADADLQVKEKRLES